MMKKKLALGLALILALSVAAAGCKKEEGDSSTGGSSSAGDSSSQASGDDGRAMEGNMYVEGLPIVKEQESFSYLIDTNEDASQMALYQRFEQETNIKVDWMTFPYDVATEKVSMMYSSGDYPDVVGGWLLGTADITKYGVNEGVYIPIEEYIEKYAPRFTYLLENFPNAKQALTLPDGHIYTIPLMGKQAGTRYVMHINQTWLDKLNLEMPKTTDDFTKVLEAFAAGDPNGNGKNDEIPLGMRGDSIGDLFGWFGLPDTSEHIVMSDGKPVYTANTEGYKEAIKYLRSLFDKKLLDQETFTQDTTQYDSKGKEPDEVYGAFLDWHGVNIVGEERYKEDYTVMPVLSSPTCDDPKWGQGDAWIFRTQTAITSAAKNPATIVRWFDYVYDEDNSLQVSLGPYGELVQKNDDGTFTTLEPPVGETVDSYRGKLSIPSMPYAIMPEITDKLPKVESAVIKDNIDKVYAPYQVEPLPLYWLTAEESDEIATLTTDLTKYINDRRAAWISGDSNVDDEWDAYLEQLKTLGVEKYIEVKTKAIERSMNVK